MDDQLDPLAQGVTGLPPQSVQNLGHAALSGLGGAFTTALDLPHQIMQQSENLRTTGQYDPAPMVNLMQQLSLGGMGAAESGAAGIFGGRLARYADLPKLYKAQTMEVLGHTPEQIWNETGWFRGADNKWRFEISDVNAQLVNREGGTVGEMLSHPELFKNYPELANIKRLYGSPPGRGYYTGPRYGTEPAISVSTQDYPGYPTHSTLGVLLHELQHAVQEGKEGFQIGANPEQKAIQDATIKAITRAYFSDEERKRFRDLVDKLLILGEKLSKDELNELDDLMIKEDRAKIELRTNKDKAAYETYMRHAGEVEARNVQTRWERNRYFNNMTPEQQREFLGRLIDKNYTSKPPWMTEDRPPEQQIVRKKPGMYDPEPKFRKPNPPAPKGWGSYDPSTDI